MAESVVTSCISGHTLEKAVKELNENPDTRDKAIADLRHEIESKENELENEGVVFERKDDLFLLRFLRARKFDQQRALTLYIQYYKNRKDFPEIFTNMNASSLVDALCSGVLYVLDGKMNDGSKVVVTYPAKWDMTRYSYETIISTMLLIVDKLLEDEETQVHGVTVIQYFHEIEFSKIWNLSQEESIQRGTVFKIVQERVPLRLKGLHLTCQPWYISIVLTIARPFMKEKLRQRLHLHGYDFSNLHQLIDVCNLPEELGGTLCLNDYKAVRLFSDELGDIEQLLETQQETSDNTDTTTSQD